MNVHVRQQIKGLRKEQNISEAEMSERLGISRDHYVGMENGKRKMAPAMVVRIAHVLGTTYTELRGAKK